MMGWRTLETTQSEIKKEAFTVRSRNLISNFLFNSKAKLERIETLVVCHHNQPEFNTNHLKYFIKLKTLYIGASLFQKFQSKLPKLDNLEVCFLIKSKAAIKKQFKIYI